MLFEHLAQARRHVAEGVIRISEQKGLIAELQRDGHDTTEAQKLLDTFLEAQAVAGTTA